MTATDYITDTAAQLTEWGIDYRETTEGLSVGNIHLEIAADGCRPAGTILNGTETVAITSDFDGDHWENIVGFFDEDVCITHGTRFTKVESYTTERIAIVEDWERESPTRVIDVESTEDTTLWAMSDIAAAVPYVIS